MSWAELPYPIRRELWDWRHAKRMHEDFPSNTHYLDALKKQAKAHRRMVRDHLIIAVFNRDKPRRTREQLLEDMHQHAQRVAS